MLRSLVALTCALLSLAASAQSVEVPPELWDRPRTGRAVLEQENVKRAVIAALAKPEAQIVIHHATGQEPLLQAEELRSWLTALAIDSRRIALRSDGATGAPMRIEIDQ
jgi:pyruvate-formate lyase-activating enzyme